MMQKEWQVPNAGATRLYWKKNNDRNSTSLLNFSLPSATHSPIECLIRRRRTSPPPGDLGFRFLRRPRRISGFVLRRGQL
ncbi:hypothetical protein NL676_004269 [Syzygium grande]|nr:hypothetical protein NL676_004269 [Syzygium grande]